MLEEKDESELVLEFLKGFCTGLIEGEENIHLSDTMLHGCHLSLISLVL